MPIVLGLILLWLLQNALIASASEHGPALVIAAFVVGLIGCITIFAYRHHLPSNAAAALIRIPSLNQFSLWSAFSTLIGLSLQIVDSLLYGQDGLSPLYEPLVTNWAGWLLICGTVPIVEEIAFRSIAIELLKTKVGDWHAILISAIVFGIAHLSVRTSLFAFVVGLVFGVAYVRTRSIVPSTVGHCATNVAGMVMLSYQSGM